MTNFHALIIDDNTKNLGVLSRLVALQGGDCTEVEHPNELESVWETLEPVHVVFLDLEMPGMDGFAVLQLLRSNPRFDGVPVVAYTVHVSEIQQAYQGGFDGFLGKPINSEKFPEQLSRILNGEGVWEAHS